MLNSRNIIESKRPALQKLQSWMLLIIMFITLDSYAQSLHGYEYNTFDRPYEKLESYSSIQIETEGDLLWEYEFDLDFDIQVFGESFGSFYGTFFSNFYGPNDEWVLDLNSYPYQFDLISDTINIQSDVRFATEERNGMQVFIIEFVKNRLGADPSVTTHDSHVNFQNRIYEDGTIEIHYGPSNLANSPMYVPGEGFYFEAAQTSLYGPYVAIEEFDANNPKRVSLSGHYDSLVLSEAEFEYINTYPPEGFVIQLRPTTLSAGDPYKPSEVLAYPNPVEDIINLRAKDDRIIGGHLYDMLGNQMLVDIKENQIPVQHLPTGMYILEVETAKGQLIREKIIKQ